VSSFQLGFRRCHGPFSGITKEGSLRRQGKVGGGVRRKAGLGEWLTFSTGVWPRRGGVAGGEAGSDGVVVIVELLLGIGQTVTPPGRLWPFMGSPHVRQHGAFRVDICEVLAGTNVYGLSDGVLEWPLYQR
jgi:hypothetical protein